MPKTDGKELLACRVGRGMFENERAITITADDVEFSALVDADDVVVKSAPRGDETVAGWVKVSIVQKGKDRALVDLPRETFSSGPRILIPLTLIKTSRK